MRLQTKWLVTALALCLFAGPAGAANKAPSGKEKQKAVQDLSLGKEIGPDLSLKELDRMESRIKALKKKIKIQELQNKLQKMKSPEPDSNGEEDKSNKRPPKDFLEKLSGQTQGGNLPGGPPGDNGNAPSPGAQGGPKKSQASPDGAAQGEQSKRPDKKALANMSRVKSVTGFGEDVQATIQLPGGGQATISAGDETRIGTVKSVSASKVIVASDGEEHSILFAGDSNRGGTSSAPVPTPPSQGPPPAPDSSSMDAKGLLPSN